MIKIIAIDEIVTDVRRLKDGALKKSSIQIFQKCERVFIYF